MSSYNPHGSALSREEAWDLIPWYVQGTLDDFERREIEAQLAQDPALRAELAEQRRLAEQIASLDDVSAGIERSLAETRRRIEVADAKPQSRWSEMFETFGKRAKRNRIGVRVFVPGAALAAVVAAVLVLPPQQATEDASFETLTTPSVIPEAMHLRVKVAEGVTELQLRHLFTSHDLRVVDGPSPTGVYTLEVAPGGVPGDVAEALLVAPEIQFATVKGAP